MGRTINKDGDIYDQDTGVWVGVIDGKGREQPVPTFLLNSAGNTIGLSDGGVSVIPLPPGRRYPGFPIVIFNNGLADVNASFSAGGTGGSYAVDTLLPGKYSTTPIRLTVGPLAQTARITVDLSAVQTSNLKQFSWDQESVLGLLCYVSNPAAITQVVLWVTIQAQRLVSRYVGSSSMVFGVAARPGWYFLTLTGSRYGFSDVSGAYQQGIAVDTTGGSNFVFEAASTPVDSVRMDVTSSALDTAGGAYVTIDSLWLMPRARPSLALVFDDGYITQYTEGFEYFANQGIVGTIAATVALIGTTGYMSVTQLQEMYDAGWDIVNHANTHFNANAKTTNGICLSQSPGAGGSLTLNGAVGTTTFDAPRCLTLITAANEAGRPYTITGLDTNGVAQVEVVWGRNAGTLVTETVWTKVNSITYTGTMAGAITVGTTYSYAETLSEYSTCKTYLQAQGWTRGIDIAVYPNGANNILTDQALNALGITAARTVSTTTRPAYPFVKGYNPMQIPGAGGGGGTATGVGVVGKYNTGNGTIGAVTVPAAAYYPPAPSYVDWTVTMTSATAFEVSDTAEGTFIGVGATGTPFTARGVAFTITVGGTPMVAGDLFRVFVTNAFLQIEQEVVNKCGFGSLYFHDLIRTGAPSGVQMLRAYFRMVIDQVVKDVKNNRLQLVTLSQYKRLTST